MARTPKNQPDEDETADTPARVSRHIQPLGPRVLVRVVKSPDRSEAGLYLPQGLKDGNAMALMGEVVEVARTMPKADPLVESEDEADEEDEETVRSRHTLTFWIGADLGDAVSEVDDQHMRALRHGLPVVSTRGHQAHAMRARDADGPHATGWDGHHHQGDAPAT